MTTNSFTLARTASESLLTVFSLLIICSLAVIPAQAQSPNSWTMGTSMPTARQGPFTGVIGSKIYVVGGITNTSVVNVNEIYDTATDSWSTGAPMPTPRWLAASAVVGNILYTIGGRSSSNVSLNVVEAYDPSTNTWSPKAPMPIVNDNIYATVENNIIYVIGGFSQSSQQRLTTVLSYSPATNAWSTLAPLNVGKSESAVGLLGSTIISAGGLVNSGATTTDTEGYNAASNSWATLAPMPTARQAGCFGVIAGQLHVAGGASSSAGGTPSPSNVMEAYGADTNAWAGALPSMPNAVVSPGSATVGSRLYCFGGSNIGFGGQGTVYNYVQIYQPPFAPPAISSSGVISASGFGGFSSIAPGSWIEIYGSNLAAGTRGWTGGDFKGINAPTSLDGTSVTVGGQQAFIDYISPGQVNALIPSTVATGFQPVTVTTASGASAPYTISVNTVEPGLLALPSFNINRTPFAVAFFADGTFVLPAGAVAGITSRPAKPGDVVVLYGIGFGPVAPYIPAGQLAGQATSLASSFQLSIGGAPALTDYDGLAPGYTGLYQFNITVPAIPAGNMPVTFTVGGTAGTQTLFLAVGN